MTLTGDSPGLDGVPPPASCGHFLPFGRLEVHL